MEKRKNPRIEMDNLSVDVADGNGFFTGRASNISQVGMCLSHLPKGLNGNEEVLTVIVSGKKQRFKMNVMPRWYGLGTATKSIGVEIVIVPREWTEFVRGLEPTLPKNSWGTSILKKAVGGLFSGF